MLNRPSSINEDAADILTQIECNVLLDEFPTVMETRKAVQQLSPDNLQVQMQFLPKSIKLGATNGRETDIIVSLYMEEGGFFHKNLRMHL